MLKPAFERKNKLNGLVASLTLQPMKTIPVSLALCTLLSLAQSANGISITVNEDSATRLDFSVDWGAVATGSGFDIYYSHGALTAEVIDQDIYQGHHAGYIYFWGSSGLIQHSSFNFTITFPTGTRTFAGSTTAGLQSMQVPYELLELPSNAYGARFVVGSPLPSPSGVPDSGATLVLLIGALGGVGYLTRRTRSNG